MVKKIPERCTKESFTLAPWLSPYVAAVNPAREKLVEIRVIPRNPSLAYLVLEAVSDDKDVAGARLGLRVARGVDHIGTNFDGDVLEPVWDHFVPVQSAFAAIAEHTAIRYDIANRLGIDPIKDANKVDALVANPWLSHLVKMFAGNHSRLTELRVDYSLNTPFAEVCLNQKRNSHVGAEFAVSQVGDFVLRGFGLDVSGPLESALFCAGSKVAHMVLVQKLADNVKAPLDVQRMVFDQAKLRPLIARFADAGMNVTSLRKNTDLREGFIANVVYVRDRGNEDVLHKATLHIGDSRVKKIMALDRGERSHIRSILGSYAL